MCREDREKTVQFSLNSIPVENRFLKPLIIRQNSWPNSPLWHLLSEHFARFILNYDNQFTKEYGFYRSIISE